jgi:hapalindole H/12-epi-hapalindole U/12-epi-fischerindole U synthase
MQLNQIKVTIVAIITYFGIATNLNAAQAATISLANPGFEAPKQTNEPVPGAGFFGFTTPLGWSLYDPNNLIPENATLGTPFTGGWQPSELFFSNVPEGEQIGSIFLVPPGLGEVGFVQNSGILIEPETKYTLSVAVLNTPNVTGSEFFAGFPGYKLELLAGNTIISADNNSVVIDEGEFEQVSLSYNSLDSDLYLGQELGIRLINPNLNNGSGLDNGNGIEVNFDDVRLNASSITQTTAVSESNSILGLLFTTGLVLGLLKHKK